jgi:hypothetical protein
LSPVWVLSWVKMNRAPPLWMYQEKTLVSFYLVTSDHHKFETK